MSLRLILGLLLSAALLLGCVALFFLYSSTTAALVLAFAFGSAVAVWLLSNAVPASHRPAHSSAAGQVLPPEWNQGNRNSFSATAGTAAAVTGDVPAVTLLEATMDSMREGVLVLDSGMRVVASNRAAGELLLSSGVTDALVSRRLSELTRNPSIHSAFIAALERGERVEVKVEAQSPERHVFDLHVAPLRQQTSMADSTETHGEVRGAVGVFFDITRLERLERVRQEFLSNVSHELRTPLTAIIAFVETLEEGAIDDPTNNRRFLSVIRRNSERMHTLIDDILELSAIEAGTVTVEIGPVRLSSLVDECLNTLAATAEENRVALHNEVSSEVMVHADARRLEQMLTNLAHNAIKFNRENGSVQITHERFEGRDRIAVADTGEGIAPEHIERIFERFYRVDRARSRALGGTGLGLAIVKHLARAHGGEATVRSTPNQGSTFTIELPKASDK